MQSRRSVGVAVLLHSLACTGVASLGSQHQSLHVQAKSQSRKTGMLQPLTRMEFLQHEGSAVNSREGLQQLWSCCRAWRLLSACVMRGQH